MTELSPGSILSHYRILSKISAGVMGVLCLKTIVNIDKSIGRMTFDESLKPKGAEYLGVDFDRERWPHATTGKGVVHRALFGLSANGPNLKDLNDPFPVVFTLSL